MKITDQNKPIRAKVDSVTAPRDADGSAVGRVEAKCASNATNQSHGPSVQLDIAASSELGRMTRLVSLSPAELKTIKELRAAIANGTYEVNNSSLAERLIAEELV